LRAVNARGFAREGGRPRRVDAAGAACQTGRPTRRAWWRLLLGAGWADRGFELSQGWLLAIEGIDGAGKTTQAHLLARALQSIGHRVVLTKEPTDGPHGQKIRALSSAGAEIDLEQELEYFIDDRREHIEGCVAPALARGEVVITDRYFYSNVAYQGARGLDPDAILARNESLFPSPDAVLLIEVSVMEGLRRVTARGGELNRAYERSDFLEAAAAVFARIDRPNVHRIDGEQTPEAVHADVRARLAHLFRF